MFTNLNMLIELREKCGAKLKLPDKNMNTICLEIAVSQCKKIDSAFREPDDKDKVRTIHLNFVRKCKQLLSKYVSIEKIKQHENDWCMQSCQVLTALQKLTPTAELSQECPSTSTGGKTTSEQYDYSNLGYRQKRRKLGKIIDEHPSPALLDAVKSNAKTEGKHSLRKIINLATASPGRADKLMALLQKDSDVVPMGEDEGLALYLDLAMTQARYRILLKNAKNHNAKLYPSYHRIKDAMNRCVPEGIKITESSMRVPLQILLSHLTERVAILQHDVILRSATNGKLQASMMLKWGYDGCTGVPRHNIAFDRLFDDSKIMACWITPLELRLDADPKEKPTFYNPCPSSPRTCLPISIEYIKERPETVEDIRERMEEEISNLKPVTIVLDNNGKQTEVTVKFVLKETMLDCKAINAALKVTCTKQCNVCGATSKIMNAQGLSKQPLDDTRLDFGLSALHCWINCFKVVCEIGQRLEFKVWIVRGDNKPKRDLKESKMKIEFLEKMGFRYNEPNPNGGNSNTGN